MHNFADGAVIVRELPQEVGDCAVLPDDGFPRVRPLKANLISGSATIPGALLTYVGLQHLPQFNATILALSAASFLYIGLADLVPPVCMTHRS